MLWQTRRWRVLAMIALLGDLCRASPSSVAVASSGREFVRALRTPGVTTVLLRACDVTWNPEFWVDDPAGYLAPVPLVINHTLSIMPHPDLNDLCMPLVDFNYTVGVIKLLPAGILNITGIEVYQFEHPTHAPVGFVVAPSPGDTPGLLLLQDSVAHNEVGIPARVMEYYFTTIDRPQAFPGQQQYQVIQTGWCALRPFAAEVDTQNGTNANTNTVTSNITVSSLQQPSGNTSSSEDPKHMRLTSCPPFAGLLEDVVLLTTVQPDGTGGCYLLGLRTVIFSDQVVDPECLKVMSMSDCLAADFRHRHGIPDSTTSQPMTTAEDDSGHDVKHVHTWTWLGPVIGSVVVLLLLLVALRILWLATHKPHHLQGLLPDKMVAALTAAHEQHHSITKFWPTLGGILIVARRSISKLLARAPAGLQLGQLLGAGSYGRVYQATWNSQQVAVKIMLHTARQARAIARELHVSSALQHPHVVRTYWHTRVTPNEDEHHDAAKAGTAATSEHTSLPSHGASSNTNYLSSASPTPHTTPVTYTHSATATVTLTASTSEPDSTFTAAAASVVAGSPTKVGYVGITVTPDPTEADPSSTAASSTTTHTMETWIVMELCSGGSLAGHVAAGRMLYKKTDDDHNSKQQTSIDLAQVLRYALHIADGMAYLHSQGIIHGDLKTENVLLAAAEQQCAGEGHSAAVAGASLGQMVAKVADFGLSRVMEAGKTHHSTHAVGTLTHCAPELILSGQLRPAADVYAYGMLLYELSTSRKPFRGLQHGKIVHQVVVQRVRPAIPDTLSKPFAHLIEACWQHEPQLRPTFEEIKGKLQAILSSSDTSDHAVVYVKPEGITGEDA